MNRYTTNALQGTLGGGLLATALFTPYGGYATETIQSISDTSVFEIETNQGSATSIQRYAISEKNYLDTKLLSTVTDFYDDLLSSQEHLGKEFEDAITSNISKLYEE